MDPVTGGGGQVVEDLARQHRHVCDVPKLSFAGLLHSIQGSYECGNRCPAAELGRFAGICFSAVHISRTGDQQSEAVESSRSDSDNSFLASEVVVLRLAGVASRAPLWLP